jgi:diguanylate cyclase (GGDEF)-like protein/PAS domain S-box-containing protein
LNLAIVGSHITLIWLPTGIAVAALYTWGWRYWPAVWLGAVMVNLAVGSPFWMALGISAGNTLGPLLATYLLRRWHFNPAISKFSDVPVFVVGGAVLGMWVSATSGVLILVIAGELPWAGLAWAWLTWWMGDAVGVILGGMVLLTFDRAELQRLIRSDRKNELIAAMFVVILLGAAWLEFVGQAYGEVFLTAFTVLALVWVGARLGPWPGAIAALVLAICAAVSLARGLGPFLNLDLHVAIARLWAYMTTLSITTLLASVFTTERSKGTQNLIASEKRYRLLTQLSSDWFWEQNDQFRFVRVDGDLMLKTGLSEAQLLGHFRWDQATINLCESDWEAHKAVLRAHLPFNDFEMASKMPQGGVRWVTISGMPIFDETGRFTGYQGVAKDISKAKAVLDALRESESRFKTLTQLSVDWYWEQDEQFRFTEITGKDDTHAHKLMNANVGKTRWELPYFQMDEAVWRHHRAQLARHEVFRDFEVSGRGADGQTHYFQASGVPKFDPEGRFTGYRGIGRNISERKNTEAKMRRLAHFDVLTDLPNRTLFADQLGQAIERAQVTSQKVAVILMDLDHFKEVNDTMGHDQGDCLLVKAARRIRACVREADTVARLGGDEFAVIVSELDHLQPVNTIAQNILTALAIPFELPVGSSFISASIGISVYPSDATALEGLLKSADQAMYAAKASGRNRYNYFTPDLQAFALNRMWLAHEMRLALDRCQFWLAYQPIVELATGAVYKAEALIRWQHPERGLINPVDFIPVAESNGVINDIGDWVFYTAAAQVKQWQATHSARFQISINKSPVQFLRLGGVSDAWQKHQLSIGLAAGSIAVEITEGVLLQASQSTAHQLRALREGGMQVSLDDFGTGYSSLAYLQKHDIDIIKIDQSFVRHLSVNSKESAMCEAIITMAHKLGIKVVAEGIETAHQRDLLTVAGCDYGQGYLFARPMPAPAFDIFMHGLQK